MRDFTTDNTAAIFDYADKNGLVPDFVKQANFITSDDVQGLPDIAFADSDNRLFPCHTKEATLLSAIYFMADGDDRQSTLDTIQKRAQAFGVENEVQEVVNHFNTINEQLTEKSAGQEEEQIEKYALTISDGETEHSFYNITTRPDVLVSMNELEKDYNCGSVEMPWMRKIARTMMQAAQQFNVADNAPGCIVKFAECRLPDVGKAAALLSLRRTCVQDMDCYDKAIEKLASDLSQACTFDQAVDVADNFAQEVYVLDKKANIQYSMFQPDPYNVMLSGPSFDEFNKHAAANVYISDIAVPVEDIVNMSDGTIDLQFSKQAAQVIKDAVKPLRGGDIDSNTTAECAEKIASLSPEVRLRLLQVLAETGF